MKEIFTDIEIIEIRTKGEFFSKNYIEIGNKDNKWTYAINYSTGNSGGGSIVSEFGIFLNTKQEVIRQGLEKLIERHEINRKQMHNKDTCGNYNHNYSKSIIEIIKIKLNEFNNFDSVQLTLF